MDHKIASSAGPITESGPLASLCQRLRSAKVLVLDTEFMRERTYYPQLCLIQIADGREAAIIDPLAAGLDLSPFLELIAAPDITKVFHAGRQDLDIFYRLLGQVPPNLADTQIMAMALGFGDAVSYEAIVRAVLNIPVDKGARFTDWSHRPLSERQLAYALADVVHLEPVYRHLAAELERRARTGWIADEMRSLTDPALYKMDPEEAWRRLKVRSDKPRFLAILKEIAAWREREAQARNLPRQRILRDEWLIELASHPPEDPAGYAKSRALPAGFAASELGRRLFDALQRGRALPKEEMPKLPRRLVDYNRAPAALDLLRVLVRHVSEAEQVAPKLLASAQDLDLLAALRKDAEVPLLAGWRYELCGRIALDLLEGRLGLKLEGDDILLVPYAINPL